MATVSDNVQCDDKGWKQYQPYNDANKHWAIDAHVVPTDRILLLSRLARHLEVTSITPTSKRTK